MSAETTLLSDIGCALGQTNRLLLAQLCAINALCCCIRGGAGSAAASSPTSPAGGYLKSALTPAQGAAGVPARASVPTVMPRTIDVPGGPPVQVFTADPYRDTIAVWSNSPDQIWLYPAAAFPFTPTPWVVTSGTGLVVINTHDLGALPAMAWWAQCDTQPPGGDRFYALESWGATP